ncbi:hypothetical protein 2 [Shuangao sobemo-like virus 1]|uniref:hypothetical protein 2 n=1 Tax=Shuangao sobemo-like virus 1 TaxID=1923474 RepID=UPI00090AFC18|nr:hypothetical protein 2 [Shuangao sobemo-like virus 1]APG75745.1 hypothetical protein 2 [Shuangao sobemo-like virus 1]
MRSIAAHAGLREGLSDGPCNSIRTKMIQTVIERNMAAQWEIPPDFLERTHFDRVVAAIDMTSTPGYPYIRSATTNRQYFNADDPVKFRETCDAIYETVCAKIDGRMGADHIRLFIKGEPLPQHKVEEGRLRLISSVSVVDQIVDAMLHGACNEALKEKHAYVTPKVGWSPYGGGWKIIPKEGWMALDKKAWDWSVKPWILEAELEIRIGLCTNINEKWLTLARKRYEQLFVEPIFVTSGGLLLQQIEGGIIKSGMVCTITTNCFGQDITHVTTCYTNGLLADWLYSMGDDTLQPPLEEPERTEYLETLSQYCHIKPGVGTNEFAGFRYGRGIEPLYRPRHAYQLLHFDDRYKEQLAASYTLLYHRSSCRNWMEKFFTELGISFPARNIRDIIWDSEE